VLPDPCRQYKLFYGIWIQDAYDSDVDEGPNAAVAFMVNLSSTSATNSQVNEVHSNDNQIFDNVNAPGRTFRLRC
ncbi:hypothetical protein Tco_0197761, partial [Tanacetum coccineum]